MVLVPELASFSDWLPMDIAGLAVGAFGEQVDGALETLRITDVSPGAEARTAQGTGLGRERRTRQSPPSTRSVPSTWVV
jgi:hypothetical protein